VSGMTIMGVADVAMWLAIMTQRGKTERWVTTDMKTAFLNSGARDRHLLRCADSKAGKENFIRYRGVPRRRGTLVSAPCNQLFVGADLNHAGSVQRASHSPWRMLLCICYKN